MDYQTDPSVENTHSFDGKILSKSAAINLMTIWKLRCLRNARAHYTESDRAKTFGDRLTWFNSVSAIVISLFSALSFGSSFIRETILAIDLIAIVAGGFLLITGTIQYILKPDHEHMMHKAAANEFSNIQRKIERYLCSETITMGLLHNLNRDINFVSKTFPMVSAKSWRAHNDLDARIKDLEDGWAAHGDSSTNPPAGGLA